MDDPVLSKSICLHVIFSMLVERVMCRQRLLNSSYQLAGPARNMANNSGAISVDAMNSGALTDLALARLAHTGVGTACITAQALACL